MEHTQWAEMEAQGLHLQAMLPVAAEVQPDIRALAGMAVILRAQEVELQEEYPEGAMAQRVQHNRAEEQE